MQVSRVAVCLIALLAAGAGCQSEGTKPPERGSALRDYVVKPQEKAESAKRQVEERAEKTRRMLDELR